jgi:DNA-binding MarR family transcriptional regulator
MPRDAVGLVLASYPVIHQALRPRLRPGVDGKLSDHQATVLAQLDRSEPRTLTELAGLMRVALPTMSLVVERLVSAGLVRRDRDPGDRRRVLLRLSALGERSLSAKALIDPNRVRALLNVLSPVERSESAEGLATLARAARRLALLEITAGRAGEPG